MVSSDKKLANAVGGKTARPCDSCIRKRARWYCAADDAFLCQACDGSVHSANPLARRHERVRLKTDSLKSSPEKNSLPSWPHGFTRKARTPRQAFRRTRKRQDMKHNYNPLDLVPEIGIDETTSHEDNEEQLLYRVPVFDSFAAQLCLSNEATTPVEAETTDAAGNHEPKLGTGLLILPSDMELAEFAADVESLLGKGLDEESFDMEGLGLLDCRDTKDSIESSPRCMERVKVEEEEEGKVLCQFDNEIDMMREPFELNFDYESTKTWEEDEAKVEGGDMVVVKEDAECEVGDGNKEKKKKSKKILRLDYEGVIAAWDDQRSPWTTGDWPELDSKDCWPDCMGGCGINHQYTYGEMGIMSGNPAILDGGREARVLRYREKRRKRLFSKKIRYEVRKLNAEKRPRMKGRFVKRANFAASFPLLSK